MKLKCVLKVDGSKYFRFTTGNKGKKNFMKLYNLNVLYILNLKLLNQSI